MEIARLRPSGYAGQASPFRYDRVSLTAPSVAAKLGALAGNQPHNCGGGVLNGNELAFLRQAQAAGVVSIVEEQSSQQFRQGQSFSWGQMLDATTAGVAQKVVIRPTAVGQAKDVSATLPPAERIQNCLKLKVGSFRVTNVVRNELQRKGVTDYRTVLVTYDALWTPEYRQMSALGGVGLADARKGVVLLKNDPFAGRWIVLTSDLADADKEFNTNNVASLLAAAR